MVTEVERGQTKHEHHGHDEQGHGNYVQAVTLNGTQHSGTWVPIGDLLRHDVHLDFTMSTAHDGTWGTSQGDLPPSMSAQ